MTLCIMPCCSYADCCLCWLSFMLSVVYADCHWCWLSFMLNVIYAECRLCWVCWVSQISPLCWLLLCWVWYVLSVTNKPFMLIVIMLTGIIMSCGTFRTYNVRWYRKNIFQLKTHLIGNASNFRFLLPENAYV